MEETHGGALPGLGLVCLDATTPFVIFSQVSYVPTPVGEIDVF